MPFIKEKALGILLSVALAAVAFLLEDYVPGFNAVILAFLLAVVVGNIIKLPTSTKPGIKFSSSFLLETAIIFLAFSINFKSIAAMGWLKFLFIVIIVVFVLLATIFIAKKFYKGNITTLLVGFGTAICGSSAIAAVAPVLVKNEKDKASIGVSIAVVNLLGSIAMVVLPFVLAIFIKNEFDLGFILGGSLQSVGNVAGAGKAISETVFETALTVKLARVALLSPAVILFSFIVNKQESENEGKKFSFKLPTFLWIFIAITILNSLINLSPDILKVLKQVGEILLTVAMAAIGLGVSFKNLWQSGKSAIGFGLIIFLLQIALALLLVLSF